MPIRQRSLLATDGKVDVKFLTPSTFEYLVSAYTQSAPTLVVADAIAFFRGTGDLRIKKLVAYLKTPSTNGQVVLDVKVDGVSILGAQKLRINANSLVSLSPIISVPAVYANSEITVDCLSAGTGATKLMLSVQCENAVLPLIAVAPINTGLPTISGSLTVDTTLVASPGTWDVVPDAVTIDWYRGALKIGTGLNYTVLPSDANGTLHIVASARLGQLTTQASSTAVQIALPAPQSTAPPLILGLAFLGQTLNATLGSWLYAANHTYQWKRDGVNIDGATYSTYTIVQADVGTDLTVAVRATNATDNTTAESDVLSIGNLPVAWSYAPAYPNRSGVTAFTTYEVGPNKTYTELHDVPWTSLLPGDVVEVNYRETPYASVIYLGVRGEPTKYIQIRGLPGPNGERPIVTGSAARPSNGITMMPGLEGLGLFVLGRPFYGEYIKPEGYGPGYIHITGLEFTGTKPGNSFYRGTGTVNGSVGGLQPWGDFNAGIYLNPADHIAVTDCAFKNLTMGIFSVTRNGNNGELGKSCSHNFYVAGNYFSNNGLSGNASVHHIYAECLGFVCEYNYFDYLTTGSEGDIIKDRSTGTIIRYNFFRNRYAYCISYRDPEASADFALQQYDQFFDPINNNVFCYGNMFRSADPSATIIGYGDGEFGAGRRIRTGNVNYYNNIVVSKANRPNNIEACILFEPINQSNAIGATEFPCTIQHVAVNNMLYADYATNGQVAAPISLFRRAGLAKFSSNLVNNYINTVPNLGSYNYSVWVGKPWNGLGIGDLVATSYDPGFVDYANEDYALQPTSPYFNLKAPIPAAARARELWCDDTYPTVPPLTLQGPGIRLPTKPTSITLPVITGTFEVGSELSVSAGTWGNNPTVFAYQWYRDGLKINGAASNTYTTSFSDGGKTIACVVSATNGVGTSDRPANDAFINVSPLASANTTPPLITSPGNQTGAGTLLTIEPGVWTNSPNSYLFKWYANDVPIGDQVSSTLQTLGTWVGQTIKADVSAVNDFGASLPVISSNALVLTTAVAIEPNVSGVFNFDFPDGTTLLDINPSFYGDTGNYEIRNLGLRCQTGRSAALSTPALWANNVVSPTTQSIEATRVSTGAAITGGINLVVNATVSTGYTVFFANNAFVLRKNGGLIDVVYYNQLPTPITNDALVLTVKVEAVVTGAVTTVRIYINGVLEYTHVDSSGISGGGVGWIIPEGELINTMTVIRA